MNNDQMISQIDMAIAYVQGVEIELGKIKKNLTKDTMRKKRSGVPPQEMARLLAMRRKVMFKKQ